LLVAIVLLITLGTCSGPPRTVFPLALTCPTLALNLTNDPHLLIDSNNYAAGPNVTTAHATITNTGNATVYDVYMYIGNGTNPGTFALGSDSTTRLSMVGGVADATRYIGNLAPGQKKTVFWMLTYPSVYPGPDITYPISIWSSEVNGCFVLGTHNYTTQSTISAVANKMLGTVTIDPPSGIVSVGDIITVTVTGFNLGTIGHAGDAYFQPVGNGDFSPACFRLVKSEVYIHSLANNCGYGPMPYINQLYFSGIGGKCYSADPTDYVKYYFVALQECTTTAKVYQEAASGNQEKYSGDYGVAGATLTVTSQGGSIILDKSVSPLSGGANTTFTWTINYTNNTDYPVGDPLSGNGLVIIDEAIPANTTYVGNSSSCSGFSCLKYYSTDNGAAWNQTQPVPASSVNKLKWSISQTIPAHSSGTVSFQSKADPAVTNTTLICNSVSAKIDDGALLESDTVCVNSLGADLDLTKVVNDHSPCEGANIIYTVTVSNPSTVSATGVNVTDILPSGLTYQSYSTSHGTYNSATGLWNMGGLATNSSAALNLTATVNAGTGGTTITNSANITAMDQTDPVTSNNFDHVDITVHADPAAYATSNSPVCLNGTIYLFGNPGGMASYSWTGPAGFNSNQQNPVIYNATLSMAGTYSLTVVDSSGCGSGTATTNVTVSAALIASASNNSPVCEGGTIQLYGAPNGMSSYEWSGPNGFNSSSQNTTILNATSLNAGTYYLTVTNGSCTSDPASTVVTVNSKPTADAGGDTGFCAGGSVQLSGSATGGTPPYTYNWTGPESHPNTQNATVSTAGTYTLTVTDGNGCSDTDDVIVQQYSGPTADAGGDTGFCAGGSVQLSGSATGGTPSYSYDWTGPENHPNTQNPTVSTAGTYTLTVTDDNGCSDTDDVIVSQYLSPTADAGAAAVIISGDSVVIGGTPTASGGTPLYTYVWTPATGLNNATAANPTASPAVNTTYTVTVTDSNGCTDSDDVTVTVIQDCCICGFVYRAGTTEPLAGWEVILEKQTNPWVEIGSTITDANGKYCFCALGSGYYRVYEVVQPNWNQVSPLPNEYLVTLPGGCCDPQSGPFLNFQNDQAGPLTVGWEVSPIDKLAVLAPWIALFAAIVAVASLLVLRRRRV